MQVTRSANELDDGYFEGGAVNSKRLQLVAETFESAAELPVRERTRFLDSACWGDAELRAEVERLLVSHEQAGSFLSESPAKRTDTAGTSGAQHLRAGHVVSGRYRIELLLGRGGMGEVYRAHDELLGDTVALKLLPPELAADPGIARRFHREILISRRISHPNVCRVFDAGFEQNGGAPHHYFTMQLIAGETLSQRIRRTGPFSRDEALPGIGQLCAGLMAAHQMGVIHRDFKSGNVILSQAGAMITDFGLARLDSGALGAADPSGFGPATITIHNQLAGTVAYMSPEQLTGEPVTQQSDIYSLGVVLFEMAAGRIPFSSDVGQSTQQKVSGPAPDPGDGVPKLDGRWRAVILHCLERDPRKRPKDALAVERALHSKNPLARMTRRDWGRTAAAAGISLAGVSLFPAARRLWTREDATLPQGAEALLSPIVNGTGDPRFDGISELFRNQLAQSAHLNLVDRDRLLVMLRQMGKPEESVDPLDIQEAAWRANAALWISGTVVRIGADYAFSVQFETRGSQPRAPKAKALRSFSAADETSLMRAVRDATLWIRETIGESQSSLTNFD